MPNETTDRKKKTNESRNSIRINPDPFIAPLLNWIKPLRIDRVNVMISNTTTGILIQCM